MSIASEDQLHCAVVQHLPAFKRDGVSWFHPANGELRDPGTARKLSMMGLRPGIPDLALVIAGRAHFLELKRERGGRLSIEQRAMHDELRAAGAVVAVAYGLDEALSILDTWGAINERQRIQA